MVPSTGPLRGSARQIQPQESAAMKNLLYLLAVLLLPAVAWAQPGAGVTSVKGYRVYLGTGKNIYHCELDLKDGSLTKAMLSAEVSNPSFIAIHPNQKFVYSVS